MGILPLRQLFPRQLALIVDYFALLSRTRRNISLITELSTRERKLKSVDMAPFTRISQTRRDVTKDSRDTQYASPADDTLSNRFLVFQSR